jgi:hypothetical protein
MQKTYRRYSKIIRINCIFLPLLILYVLWLYAIFSAVDMLHSIYIPPRNIPRKSKPHDAEIKQETLASTPKADHSPGKSAEHTTDMSKVIQKRGKTKRNVNASTEN